MSPTPTLFSMMFSAMLMGAFQDSDTGFPIRYRFNGKLFNLRRMQAKIKVQTDVLDELRGKGPWIKFRNCVITMMLQSAQKDTNQHLENRTMNQLSL